jgi:hypothetical protein
MVDLLQGWAGRTLGRFQERRQAAAFERDTGLLIEQLRLCRNDLLFFPTISARDTYGLAKSLSQQPEASLPSTHLLFRRNIYAGARQSYDPAAAPVRAMRRNLEAARKCPGSAKFKFYTDTDELTYQHNSLRSFPFITLPIPHTHPVNERRAESGPIRITYLGDARREKGFHLLPQLVATLTEDHLTPREARFVVQCNYNVPGGEPAAAIARGELETCSEPAVTLLKEPLTSDEYKHLLLSAGINLLLYDPGNYYARSSGILIESLAAGIPVVVPANTWLSRQFLAPFYRHLEGLAQTQRVLSSFGPETVIWHAQQMPGKSRQARHWCSLRPPQGATHLLLRAEFSEIETEADLRLGHSIGAEASYMKWTSVLLEADGRGRCACLLRLPEADRLELSIQCEAAGNSPFRKDAISAEMDEARTNGAAEFRQLVRKQ